MKPPAKAHSPERPSRVAAALERALEAGTREHYEDAALYDHEYRRRREDVLWYRALAAELRPSGNGVLELGCGTGRLLIPLAKDRHAVTGVDLSPTMLARCRERLEAAGQAVAARVRLHQADFRALALGRRYPLVVCPFNAFMHLYTREDVERFLGSVKRHLAPGGTFAFDVMNPDLAWLSRDPNRRWARTRFRHPVTGRRMIYTTNLVWDGPRQLAFMNIYYEPADGGPEQVVRLAHRYFFPQELEALLHYQGFRIARRFGDFDSSPLDTDSEYQILQCTVGKK